MNLHVHLLRPVVVKDSAYPWRLFLGQMVRGTGGAEGHLGHSLVVRKKSTEEH